MEKERVKECNVKENDDIYKEEVQVVSEQDTSEDVEEDVDDDSSFEFDSPSSSFSLLLSLSSSLKYESTLFE